MRGREAGAAVLGIAFIAVIVAVLLPHFSILQPAGPAAVPAGEALWTGRTGEVLYQGLIILAGVFTILLLLGRERSGGQGR